MKKKSYNGPSFVLDVSDTERQVAKELKQEFKQILKKLDVALDSVIDIKDAIVKQRPTQEELKDRYKGRLLRYRRRIRSLFNDFLQSVKLSLEKMAKISDAETIRLREIIIAEIEEMSDGVEAVLDLFDEVHKDGFTASLEGITSQMQKRQSSINDVIDDRLFNHLDHDILGRMKISQLRLRINKRKRIMTQMFKSSQLSVSKRI